MQIRQGQAFAGCVLHRAPRLRWELYGLCVLYVLLRLTEGSVLLLLPGIAGTDAGTFFQQNRMLWQVSRLVLLVPGHVCLVWLSWRFRLHCADAMEILPPRRLSGKKLLLGSLLCDVLRLMLLQSVPLCLYGAVRLAQTAANYTEGAPWLFGAMQLTAAAVLCFLGWLYICLGLWCAPFVWFYVPGLPLRKLPRRAMQVMHGGRKELLLLLLWYGVQMLPVVTIPWVLPRAALGISAFFHIRTVEFFQVHSS